MEKFCEFDLCLIQIVWDCLAACFLCVTDPNLSYVPKKSHLLALAFLTLCLALKRPVDSGLCLNVMYPIPSILFSLKTTLASKGSFSILLALWHRSPPPPLASSSAFFLLLLCSPSLKLENNFTRIYKKNPQLRQALSLSSQLEETGEEKAWRPNTWGQASMWYVKDL